MRKRILIATISGILLSPLGATLSVPAEAEGTPFDGVLHAPFDYQETLYDQLIRDACLPRVLSALLTGGLLATSGVMMQEILHDPITEPPTLSITQGPAMFVVIAPMLPLLTMAGNLQTALTGVGFGDLLVFLFAVKHAGHPDVSRVLLAGSASSVFFLSAASLSALIQNRSQELTFWAAGSFRQADQGAVTGLGIITLACMDSPLLLNGKVNLLSLGDETAVSLGVDAVGLKRKVILVVAPFCAMCAAVAGNIDFAGLFVPHTLRSVLSRDTRHTPPLSFLFGGALMVFSGVAVRTLSAPYKLPVGLFTVLLGVLMFLPLMRKECD